MMPANKTRKRLIAPWTILPGLFFGGCLGGCQTTGHAFFEIKTPIGAYSYEANTNVDGPPATEPTPFAITFDHEGWAWWLSAPEPNMTTTDPPT